MKTPETHPVVNGLEAVRLDANDIQAFAAWSGDCNPLHVDPQAAKQSAFGQPIAHGILALLKAIQSVGSEIDRRITSLNVEFRGAVVPGTSYQVDFSVNGGSATLALLDGPRKLLSVELDFDVDSSYAEARTLDSTSYSFPQVPNVPQRRRFPANRNTRELARGVEIVGEYAVDGILEAFTNSPFNETQLTTLALCGYIVGMEIPGLRSLFTRLELTFARETQVGLTDLLYRCRTTRYEQHMRILDSGVEAVDGSGTLIASGSIRSYVRLPGGNTQPAHLKPHLSAATRQLKEKVVLICGGSRGLGADMTAVFALTGARVHVASRTINDDLNRLIEELSAQGNKVTHLQGDVGDAQWCADAVARIINEQGRLDVLVLNACAPPEAMALGSESASAYFDAYVSRNLRLVRAPLEATLSILAANQGAVVAISSSFVEESPAEFAAYVALKQAVEGLIKSAAHAYRDLFVLIPRPPRLQTAWNDTPAAVADAMPIGQAAVGIINRLAGAWVPGKTEIQSDFPDLIGFDPESESPGPAEPGFEVSLVATFTAEPILASIEYWFKQLGLNGYAKVGPYGQVLQELINPTSSLTSVRAGAGVVLLRVRDWLREIPNEEQDASDQTRQYLQRMANEFVQAMQDYRRRTSADTLLIFCPSEIDEDPLDKTLFGDVEAQITARLTDIPGLTVIDSRQFHAPYGVTRFYDPLRDKIGHIAYLDPYYHVLGTLVVRHLHRRLLPPRKVVVVDCDNTLWKGVVGEVGPEGVEFGPERVALQNKLIRLSESGILVCLCSKNEEADAWSVFDQRPDFCLRRDHIVAAAINWQPKSENIKRLASKLNLASDSFVFLEDNPVECAEVRANCPEVLTLEWPQDPKKCQQLLDHTWELDAFQTTREDTKRTRQYHEEAQRQVLQQESVSFSRFIESLQLEIDLRPLDQQDLARASQLTLRTNQFNFTTRRRQESDLQQLMADPSYDCRTVRVRDRFGDYGLVGLVISHQQGPVLEVDTFLLSCRVLGRGAEYRMAASVGEVAKKLGIETVRMRVETTERNTPARKFLQAIAQLDVLHLTPDVASCDFVAAELAQLVFEPEQAVVEESVADSQTGSLPAGEQGQLRVREEQIYRTAYELSSSEALQLAIKGRSQQQVATDQDVVSRTEIAAAVRGAFADALAMTPDAVASADTLESLGCDSFKIVEITVALAAIYPWLPSTLLFEHRSVSSIIDHIQEIIQKRDQAPAIRTRSPAPHPTAATDIAVVGMHIRCAGANNPNELWKLLSSGKSAVEAVPARRGAFLTAFSDSRTHWAGLLRGVNQFDAAFFGVAPREAEYMDPQQRLFLESAFAALEDAGDAGTRLDPSTGVFVGVMYGDYRNYANMTLSGSDHAYRCWESFSIANRLSQFLGVRGPSYAIDTACSSSGTALHAACQSLMNGDCTTAVVGGINLILDPNRFNQLGRLGILSPTGKCRAFGAEADGTVLGEGVGVVVLRPMEEARARGDHIYGVIKGIGLSVGAGSVGFTVPNPQAQAEAIRRSLEVSGVDPRTVSYVETHGTGTALGDPIEVRGLNLAYGDRNLWHDGISGAARCAIGSVKPNVGHLEAGAFIVGLIKVLLQFQHKSLLPSLTSDEMNPQIPFPEGPFFVQRELAPWKPLELEVSGRCQALPRRAGLSSFGVGGANVHVILEEPPALPATEKPSDRPCHVLAMSAERKETLSELVSEMRHHLKGVEAPDLGDFCFSVNTGRRHLSHRCVFRSGDRADLLRQLHDVEQGRTPAGLLEGTAACGSLKRAFLFTGQGAQFNGMGRQLFESQPVFRDALQECAAILAPQLAWPLLDVLFFPEESDIGASLHQTAFTQPALFSIEYALARLWQSWGISPSVVAGHSVGEFAALVIAGGMSLEDGLKLVEARGRLMQALPTGGAMCSFRTNTEKVHEALRGLEEKVSVAAINGLLATVISGEEYAVSEVHRRLTAEGIKATRLQVSHAFHSHLMQPMLQDYEQVVRQVAFRRPQVPFVSTVTGNLVEDEITMTDYWLRQIMQPVRLFQAMECLAEFGPDVYLEIGPQPVLIGLGATCVRGPGKLWLPSLQKDDDDWSVLTNSLGQLYVAGDVIDWQGFDQPYDRRRVELLPTYPFHRRKYWLRGSVKAAFELEQGPEREPQNTEDLLYEIEWRAAPLEFETDAITSRERWLILADQGGIGQAIGQQLARLGIDHELVQLSASQADLHESLNSVYRRVIDSQAGKGPVVWLRGLDVAPQSEGVDNDSKMAELFTAMVDEVASLTRAVAGTKGDTTGPVWLVTSGAVSGTSHDTTLSPAQAALWGFGRVAALECPTRWGGMIDVDRSGDVMQLAERLVTEIGSPNEEDQIAVRGSQRYVPRLVRRDTRSAEPLQCDSEGIYLISGGLGTLGQNVACWLVGKGARHLVLVSRRGMESPDATKAVNSLEQLGAQVDVIAADIAVSSKAERLFATIDEMSRPLRGIVHAAGLDLIRPISDVSTDDVKTILGAKANGGWWLHRQAINRNLQFFICFSSISSVWGSGGRSVYAAANAYLDGLAAYRRSSGLSALSVNWGPWHEGGMASEQELSELAKLGNYGLEPAQALDALEVLLDGKAGQATVADVDWEKFLPVIEARGKRPLFSDLAPSAPVATKSTTSGFLDSVLQATPAEQRELLIKLIRQEAAATLGCADPEEVPVNRNLFEIGLDSLSAVSLIGRLDQHLHLGLSAVELDQPDIPRLAEVLLQQLNGERKQAAAACDHRPPRVDAERSTGEEACNLELVQDAVQEAAAEVGSQAGIVAYCESLGAEILEFQQRAWPERQTDLVERRFRWMALDSARRIGVSPKGWFFQDAGKIVGQNVSQAVMCKIGDRLRPTRWFVDTVVLPDHRERGVGPALLQQSKQDEPFNLSLGQTEQMREILLRLGWKYVGPLNHYACILNPSQVLRGKLPGGPPVWTASLLLKAVAWWKGRGRDPGSLEDVECVEIESFGVPHDAIWEAMSSQIVCTTVRNASFLNWKYVDQPGQDFIRLEVRVAGELVAIVILKILDADSTYRYRRAMLVDLLVRTSDRRAVRAALSTAVKAARRYGADLLVAYLSCRPLETALKKYGFLRRPPNRWLLVSTEGLNSAEVRQLTRIENWHLTMGDSDIDRP